MNYNWDNLTPSHLDLFCARKNDIKIKWLMCYVDLKAEYWYEDDPDTCTTWIYLIFIGKIHNWVKLWLKRHKNQNHSINDNTDLHQFVILDQGGRWQGIWYSCEIFTRGFPFVDLDYPLANDIFSSIISNIPSCSCPNFPWIVYLSLGVTGWGYGAQ